MHDESIDNDVYNYWRSGPISRTPFLCPKRGFEGGEEIGFFQGKEKEEEFCRKFRTFSPRENFHLRIQIQNRRLHSVLQLFVLLTFPERARFVSDLHLDLSNAISIQQSVFFHWRFKVV